MSRSGLFEVPIWRQLPLLAALLLSLPLHAADLDAFWETPRKGGNSFNGGCHGLRFGHNRLGLYLFDFLCFWLILF